MVVISWRDIPAQVNARSGEERHQVLLPYRFQKAVDRATKVAGKKTAHEHVAEWRRRSFPITGDPLAAAQSRGGSARRSVPHGAAAHADRLRRLGSGGGRHRGGAAVTSHRRERGGPRS